MGLSFMVVQELRRELAKIEQQRVALAERATAIKRVLSDSEQPTLLGEDTGKHDPTSGPSDKPESFKACVVQIVKETPGIKVPKITKELRRRDWLPGGNTDVGHRVYNEVWRMANKTNEMERTENGGYRWTGKT